MVKLDTREKMNPKTVATCLFLCSFMLSFWSIEVEAGDKGDDIILTKGKLIMRGGKGKGNLILDTGSKSHDGGHEHMMPMMPMMGHHFNPFSFYPMHQEAQHHHQPAMIHPIYIDDHSAMHHHHHQQHQEYHHEEPHHQHQEVQYHHEQPHHEQGHEMSHMEPMGHHYEHQGHGEEEGGHHHYGGYESNPIMSAMLMHGSGSQPNYQQMATMQAFQHPIYEQQIQSYTNPEQQQQLLQQLQVHQQQQKLQNSQQQQQQQTSASEQQNKKTLLHSANNPLVAMIKPLFKRHQQKKPST